MQAANPTSVRAGHTARSGRSGRVRIDGSGLPTKPMAATCGSRLNNTYEALATIPNACVETTWNRKTSSAARAR